MPVSRGRKLKPKKRNQLQSQSPHQLLGQHQKSRWEKIRDHPVFWAIGLIAALLAIGGPVWDAFRYPEISAEATVNPSFPFDTYFAATNGSALFAMRNTQMFCGIDETRFVGGGGIKSLSLTDTHSATIEPHDTASFRCLIGLPSAGKPQIFGVGPGQVLSAHIYVRVTYQTLFKSRESAGTEFTWVTAENPPRWIKGKIVN